MRVESSRTIRESAVAIESKVEFDLTPEEEKDYRKAVALLSKAGDLAMREIGTRRGSADFTSVTSKVYKGRLLVFVQQGMVG